MVSSSKLGSINHTLMSLELCRLRGIEVAYVVYNDFPNDSEWIKNDSITIIRQYLDEHFRIVVCWNYLWLRGISGLNWN